MGREGDLVRREGDLVGREGDLVGREGDLVVGEGDLVGREGDLVGREGDLVGREGVRSGGEGLLPCEQKTSLHYAVLNEPGHAVSVCSTVGSEFSAIQAHQFECRRIMG